ncbi:MAG TPA: hypothetical protein VGK46_13830 [Saprospiraceae bacterium]
MINKINFQNDCDLDCTKSQKEPWTSFRIEKDAEDIDDRFEFFLKDKIKYLIGNLSAEQINELFYIEKQDDGDHDLFRIRLKKI